MKNPTDQLFCEDRKYSIEQLKELTSQEGLNYSEEELVSIADFISVLVDITVNHYYQIKEASAKIISLPVNPDNETKSLSLHSSEYRRAS